MAMSIACVRSYTVDELFELCPVNVGEVWRYAGYRGIPEDTELSELYEAVLRENRNRLSFRVCYRRFSVEWNDGMPLLPFYTESEGLAKCLDGSVEAVCFAATLGISLDRSIERAQHFSLTKGLLTQALGNERIEALCDCFCNEQARASAELSMTPRFSPGYGDLSLETQRDFFRLLECGKNIGVTLNESLLMSPSKSVTAIFGFRPCRCTDSHNNTDGANKCSRCEKKDCSLRAMNEEN